MSSSTLTEEPAPGAFVCASGDWRQSACKGLPFFRDHGGKPYCVLHYPAEDKLVAFGEALEKKLDAGDFNFRGVWFPFRADFSKVPFTAPADFTSATFGASADFSRAVFEKGAFFDSATFGDRAIFAKATFTAGANFSFTIFSSDADFYDATFGGSVAYHAAEFAGPANFLNAEFGAGVTFSGATFGEKATFSAAKFGGVASFTDARFMKDASFYSVTFGAGANFYHAEFGAEADFGHATFKDYVRFAGDKAHKVFGDDSSLSLHFATVEKPERFSFHTLTLRPHWFMNVDARKFEFTSVDWHWYGRGIRQKLKTQLSEGAIPSYILLSVACRRLAANAEENNLYWRASSFRYLAMNVERLDTGRGFAFWTVDWWYWLASGFGERAGRAFLVLLGVLVLFAALYVGLDYPNWETRAAPGKAAVETPRQEVTGWRQWSSAILYSAGVMTLQKPEPRPAKSWAQAFVMLETILGPVQAALLALAIRRKFMR